MRYNPPPNWPPTPPGWTPPPGWQPDPSWPPPPPGWQLWLPDTNRRMALIIGGIVAAVLAVAVVLVATLSGSSKPSDTEQIRSMLQNSFDAWQRGDVEAYGRTVCAAHRNSEEKRLRRHDGPDGHVSMTIGSVTIDGDQGDVEVTVTDGDGDTDTDTMHVVREDDEWKRCRD